MHKGPQNRKRIWVKSQIQGNLVIRCVSYWFFCLCTILLFVAVGTAFSGKLLSAGELAASVWRQFSPAILASVLLLPLIAIDIIRASHRFVGPLVRLENELERLADGEPVRPIQFRADDQWHGLADQFNRVLVQYRAYAESLEVSQLQPPADAIQSMNPYQAPADIPEVTNFARPVHDDPESVQPTRCSDQEDSVEAADWTEPNDLDSVHVSSPIPLHNVRSPNLAPSSLPPSTVSPLS